MSQNGEEQGVATNETGQAPAHDQPPSQRPQPDRAAQDFGFGTAIASDEINRLVNRDGTFNVLRTRTSLWEHLNYTTLLRVRWPAFFALIVLLFVLLNAAFAVAYMLCGPAALLTTAPTGGVSRMLRAVFFSVDTLTTIGYGNIVPVGHAANMIVTAEAFTGLLFTALVTGLVFARFSRPNVRLEFSTRAVFRGGDKPAVLIRLRNLTRNEVIEVEAVLMAWFYDRSTHIQRRFHLLPLERAKITFLPLSWTVVHFITPDSPFYGMTEKDFHRDKGELMLQIRGTDQGSSQVVYDRVGYTGKEIAWNARFADQYLRDHKTGALGIDEHRFHEVLWDDAGSRPQRTRGRKQRVD